VPWERFLAIDRLQGYTHSDSGLPSVNEVWLEHLQHLPGRIKAIHSNIKLLRKSAEDARKDAQLWANRSEGDEGKEFEEPEEGLAVGSTWRPGEREMRFTLHDLLANKQDGGSIIQASQSLRSLVEKLQKAGFSESTTMPSHDPGYRIWSQTELNLPKPTLDMIKAAQVRLHEEKILAIEGDDESAEMQATGQGQTGNGFGDEGQDIWYPPATFEEPETAQTWVDIAEDQSFFHVGQAVAEEMTLNRLQRTALGLVCEAMDQLGGNENEEDKVFTEPRKTIKAQQHLQYIGGSGGTGKSWVIKAIQTVLSIKRAGKEMVITATSGTAAAGIGGNTIHSAIGLTFQDADSQVQCNMPRVGDERRNQRWRRRKVLIVDEVSMLGLDTLYEIDQRLRLLRGFHDRDFGGMPIVIFTGDFLQFGPVQQKGLLSDLEQITEEHVKRRPNDRKVQKHWQHLMAKRLWEKFDKVVILEEQKRAQGDPFLLGLLDRIRNGQQTREDMDKLNASCYDPQAAMDFSQGRRAITPLNRHRWDLTLHAVLEFGKEHNKKVTIFLSAHRWTTRVPSEEEMEAVMQLGDAGPLSIPSIFAYVEGMPVIVNENKYLGLKVANGSEFTAIGIVPDPNIQEHVVDEGLSIFFGPPCGILLQSKALQGLRIPHLPPDTIMLGAESISLRKKQGKHICPDLYQGPGFEMGVSRRGLPCVPGFVITDYKSQSRTMGRVLLGLYGRRGDEEVDKCEIISLYVQMSRCMELDKTRLLQPLRAKDFLGSRMHPDLIAGIERLKRISDKTTEAFAVRHTGMVSDSQIVH
jgi:PIF1-like helicase